MDFSGSSFPKSSRSFVLLFAIQILLVYADDVYIVTLRNAPSVATYTGGIPGLARTAAASAGSIRSDSLHVQAYSRYLSRAQVNVMVDVGIPTQHQIYSYTFAVNAFATTLSSSQLSSLRSHPHVARIHKSKTLRRVTISTPNFLGLPNGGWKGVGGSEHGGEDVIIGMIDTGIWPEHLAFSDSVYGSYGPPPSKWQGSCATSADFPSCNNKIIGAAYFNSGFSVSQGGLDLSADYLSPRDSQGHGSHTASTAAGNHGYPVAANNRTFGRASGMAPRARLAVYKVFWNSPAGGADPNTADTSDVIAAIDQAVSDGVDVINFSLSGDPDFSASTSELAFLGAAQAGTFCSLSAGNSGPPTFPISGFGSNPTQEHQAPWYTSVGASTHDRVSARSLTLGNGKSFTQTVDDSNSPSATPLLRLIVASAAARRGVASSAAALCLDNTLDPAKVQGKMVLCLRGIAFLNQKGVNVQKAGGKALVLYNNATVDDIPPQNYSLPTLHVNHAQGLQLLQYIQSSVNPIAAISLITTLYNQRAPTVADFSSTGPNDNPYVPQLNGRRNDILKPDLTAPGVNVWAAWSPGFSPRPSRVAPAYFEASGTSMAAPHISGLAALIKQKHPSWTPFAIKSALQTTAVSFDNKRLPIRNSNGKAGTPFDFGAGRVNTAAMLSPGLVYDSTITEMVGYLRFVDEETAAVFFPEYYSDSAPVESYNLNLATIGVSQLRGSLTVRRRVTNVGSTAAVYVAKIVPPAGVKVSISPPSFSIKPGQTVGFSVTFTVVRASHNFSFGQLVWQNGLQTVTSVLAVQPVALK